MLPTTNGYVIWNIVCDRLKFNTLRIQIQLSIALFKNLIHATFTCIVRLMHLGLLNCINIPEIESLDQQTNKKKLWWSILCRGKGLWTMVEVKFVVVCIASLRLGMFWEMKMLHKINDKDLLY